ncbi:hypothetical protein DBR17_12285 [Sphingomonas sp. HMWF008]|nr:hypothetical protein DBR17_12285 [Sphingomonas sp. HMWF008]
MSVLPRSGFLEEEGVHAKGAKVREGREEKGMRGLRPIFFFASFADLRALRVNHFFSLLHRREMVALRCARLCVEGFLQTPRSAKAALK